MQKLRILFYGDDRVNDDPGALTFGITDLMRFITEGLKGVVDVQIEFVHRHQRDRATRKEIQGANKLAWDFIKDYHELWIFGDRFANFHSVDVKTKQPYNELDEYEQEVLLEWMKDNGVFLTGDHSEFVSTMTSPDVCVEDHARFISRGAALGRFVPRAHQLRIWEGPPTNCTDDPHDNFNTIQGPDPLVLDLNGDRLQFDSIPQNLIHPSTAHKLFSWIDESGQLVPITVFPDHKHEGKIVEPTVEELDDNWPAGSPRPGVVARGNDKRPFAMGREYDLVVAFDGDLANVGRIVADSSFHHYLNINLSSLVGRDTGGSPLPGTALGQMAQYYCNLALWLAPQTMREAIKLDLFANLANHPLVQSAKGMSRDTLGKAARRAAEIQVGASNLYQLLGTPSLEGAALDDLLTVALLREAQPALLANAIADPALANTDQIFGAIIQEFHDFFSAQGISSSEGNENIPRADIVNRGFVRALRP